VLLVICSIKNGTGWHHFQSTLTPLLSFLPWWDGKLSLITLPLQFWPKWMHPCFIHQKVIKDCTLSLWQCPKLVVDSNSTHMAWWSLFIICGIHFAHLSFPQVSVKDKDTNSLLARFPLLLHLPYIKFFVYSKHGICASSVALLGTPLWGPSAVPSCLTMELIYYHIAPYDKACMGPKAFLL
jgi:hypothetical protein